LTVREGLQIGFATIDEAAIESGTKELADAMKVMASRKTA